MYVHIKIREIKLFSPKDKLTFSKLGSDPSRFRLGLSAPLDCVTRETADGKCGNALCPSSTSSTFLSTSPRCCGTDFEPGIPCEGVPFLLPPRKLGTEVLRVDGVPEALGLVFLRALSF